MNHVRGNMGRFVLSLILMLEAGSASQSNAQVFKVTGATLVVKPEGVVSPFSPEHGNNGVGNGVDPQPPGNPKVNDGPGTTPGNPGNKGGSKP
jgi:hypothetical protein